MAVSVPSCCEGRIMKPRSSAKRFTERQTPTCVRVPRISKTTDTIKKESKSYHALKWLSQFKTCSPPGFCHQRGMGMDEEFGRSSHHRSLVFDKGDIFVLDFAYDV